MTEATAGFDERFAAFLHASPSAYHAAQAVASLLVAVGFQELDEAQPWDDAISPGAKLFVIRDGAIIAWAMPLGVQPTTSMRIVASHTDSPGFALKPHPSFSSHGFSQVAVEMYGGPILDTWFDRELEFAGRIVDASGQTYLVRSGAVARIPQLAIHLDRSANESRTIDRQRDVQPVTGLGEFDILEHLAASVGLTARDVQGFDVISVDAQPGQRFGSGQRFFAAGRLDNLTSVFASVEAMLARVGETGETGDSSEIAVLAAFNHEEVGSASRSGASGPFLSDVIDRIFAALGASRDQQLQALAQSWCVSADAAHSVHPNAPEKHDPRVLPTLGGGPVLKLNANQRYATDALGSAFWRERSNSASVSVQEFVAHNQIPAGSTVGPLTATRLGIRTLDAGVPLLSMHSAREMCHLDDLAGFTRVLQAIYA